MEDGGKMKRDAGRSETDFDRIASLQNSDGLANFIGTNQMEYGANCLSEMRRRAGTPYKKDEHTLSLQR